MTGVSADDGADTPSSSPDPGDVLEPPPSRGPVNPLRT